MRKRAISILVTALFLSGNLAEAAITWNVAGSGNWDTSTPNWTGASTTFTSDGTVDVIFNNSAGGTITVSSGMLPKSMTVSASSGTYTFTGGPIASGTLTKSGGGTLALRDNNTFTGKTVVQGGIISVDDLALEGVASPLGAPTGADSIIDMYPGTFFYFQPPDIRSVYFTTDRTINLAGSGSGTVKIQIYSNDKWCSFAAITGTGTGPRTLNLHVGGGGQGDRTRIRVTGPITDTSDDTVSLEVQFSCQATARGRLILEGANTFSGPITMTAAKLTYPDYFYISGSGSLGGGSYTNTISIGESITFYYDSSATQELSGAISGSGALTQTGTGELTLSSSNSYSSGTTISAGTLYAGSLGAMSTGDVTVGASGLLVMTENNAMAITSTLNVPNNTTETLVMDTFRCEIAALTINSVAQPEGVYRPGEHAWMGGYGKLYVGVPAPPGGTVLVIR